VPPGGMVFTILRNRFQSFDDSLVWIKSEGLDQQGLKTAINRWISQCLDS